MDDGLSTGSLADYYLKMCLDQQVHLLTAVVGVVVVVERQEKMQS